jgi:kynurenine formamidase
VIIDLSHPIGSFSYPGLPPPELRIVVTRAETAVRGMASFPVRPIAVCQ